MTPMPPGPPSEVVFDVEPWMVDPDRIARRVTWLALTDPEGRRAWIQLGVIFVLVVALAVLTSNRALAVIPVFITFLVPLFMFFTIRSTAAAIRARPSFGEQYRLVVAPDGVHEYGWDSTTHLGWRHFRAGSIVADHLVLTLHTRARFFVPLAGLDPAHEPSTVLDRVRASIHAAAPPGDYSPR